MRHRLFHTLLQHPMRLRMVDQLLFIAFPKKNIFFCRSPAVIRDGDSDDDVIIIEREIPIVDLCTPSESSRRPLRDLYPQINRSHADAPKISKISNNNRLVDNAKEKPPLLCSICLQSAIGRKPQATRCGHVFCEYCIRRSMIASKQCPTCKMFISNVIPLYI